MIHNQESLKISAKIPAMPGRRPGPGEGKLSRLRFRNRLARALRHHLNLSGHTVRDVADVAAVSVQAVHLWLNADCEPGAWAMGRLIQLFGLGFRDETYGLIDLGAARQRRSTDPKR